MKFVDQYDDKGFSDPTRDIPNTRFIHLDNGRSFKLERRDPFGFVYVVWDKGPTPAVISGSYTDFAQADRAVRLYIANNIFADYTEEATAKAEPLKYKKRFRDPETGENLPVNG